MTLPILRSRSGLLVSATNKVSRLRVINTAGVDNVVAIRGVDDQGRPGESEVRMTLPP